MAQHYGETYLYRDATIFLKYLISVVKNLPRPIQYSIGEEALKDAIRIAQLVKLSYEAPQTGKGKYLDEVKEKMACLEVVANLFYENKLIPIKKLGLLYLLLGSMQKQVRAWQGFLLKSGN